MLKITGTSLFKDSNELIFPTASFEDENKKLTPVEHKDSYKFEFYADSYLFKRKFKRGAISILELNTTNIHDYPQTKFLLTFLKSEYIKENAEEVRDKVSAKLFELFKYLDLNPKLIYGRKYSSTSEFLQVFNEMITNRKKELGLIKPVQVCKLKIVEKQYHTIDLNVLHNINNIWERVTVIMPNIENKVIESGIFKKDVPVHTYTDYFDNKDYRVAKLRGDTLYKVGDVIQGDYSIQGWSEKEIRNNCEIFLL